jgi:presenilin-like A22 family membrane protease
MKHTVQVTAVLIVVFLFIQIFGLYALSQTMRVTVGDDGSVDVDYEDTAVGERPQIEGLASLLYILFGILIGTALIMLFVRLGQVNLWKVMYFFALWLASTITLGVFVSAWIAALLAVILSLLEIFRTNIFIHNITEILIYPGIAILFAPLFSVFWAGVLLIAISLYDIYAVRKSGHMVKLARFQTKSRAFAGFVIPYGFKGKDSKSRIKSKIPKDVKGGAGTRSAILGGGDIAFPLLFAGVAMEWLVKAAGISKGAALMETSLISVFAAIALLVLFVKAEKDKFYPAMPFVTAGCFIGFALVWIVNLAF